MKRASDRACPRCGYDLSGVISAWAESCPVRGVCSECGQPFHWYEIFHPDHDDLRGFVEHEPPGKRGLVGRRLSFLQRACRTWWWTLLPGRFWARVRIHHRLSPGAMVGWLLVLVLPLHAAASVLSMALTRLQELQYFTTGAPLPRYFSSWTYPFAVLDRWGTLGVHWLLEDWPQYILPVLAMHASIAATLLLLGHTRRDALLRPWHIGRAVLYGLSWVVLLAGFRIVRNCFAVSEEFMNWQNPRAQPAQPLWPANIPLRMGPTPVEPLYLSEVAPGFLGTILFAWLAAWWLYAIQRGWKLQLGWAVWALLMIVGLLAALNAWVVTYAPT